MAAESGGLCPCVAALLGGGGTDEPAALAAAGTRPGFARQPHPAGEGSALCRAKERIDATGRGAKGLNLAIADARVLAGVLERALKKGDNEVLGEYTDLALAQWH